MAKEGVESGVPSIENLALGEAAMSSLTQTVALASQIKGILYELSRNPLLAPFAMVRIETEIGKIGTAIRKMKSDLDDTKGSFDKFTRLIENPRVWTTFGSVILATGLRIRGLRDEVEKTALSMYKVTGATEGGAFAYALGLTRKQADLQMKYGKQFAEQYANTVKEIQARLNRQSYSKPQQQRMFETITGLSLASGVDYSKAINKLQDSFGTLSMSTSRATAAVDLIRKAWQDGNTAVGDLDENIELGIQLMQDLGQKGIGPIRAVSGALQTLQALGKAGVTVGGARNIMGGGGELGIEGEQRRMQMVMGINLAGGPNQRMRDLMGRFHGAGSPQQMAGSIQAMQLGAPGEFAKFQQEFARQIFGRFMTKGPGGQPMVNTTALAAPENVQARITAGEALKTSGMSFEDAIKLANANDIQIDSTQNVADAEKKLAEMTTKIEQKDFGDLDKALAKTVETANSWQEALEGALRRLNVFGVDLSTLNPAMIGLVIEIGGLITAIGLWKRAMGTFPPGGVGGGGRVTGFPGEVSPGDIAGTGGNYGGEFRRTRPGGGIGGRRGIAAGVGRGGGRISGAVKTIGILAGGYATNAAVDAALSSTQTFNQGQNVVEGIADQVPFGGIAKIGGRILGGMFASMFGPKAPKNQLDQEVIKRFDEVINSKDPAVTKEMRQRELEAKNAYLKTVETTKEEQQDKYSGLGYIKRAVTGEQIGQGSPSPITNNISVYLNGREIAAAMKDEQNQAATTTNTGMK